MLGFLSGLWQSKEIILIALAALAAVYFFKDYSNTMREYGAAKIKIETLEQNSKALQDQIDKLEEQRKIDQRITESHIQDLMALQEELEDLNRNLGQDAEDQAAASIKEYFKRLETVK